jgi:2-hydroxychromene-2-carboxylate isomerase
VVLMTGQLVHAGQVPAWDVDLREGGVVMRVELFVDPACLWSWLTSRWLAEVAPKRNLEVRWRPYSLLLRDGPEGLQDWKAVLWEASRRAVRVMQALESDNPDGVQRFYEAVVTSGVADYQAGRPPFQDLEGALAAAGLASAYVAAADDAAWDERIHQSMAEAFAVVGEGVGTPTLVLHHDPPVGLLGPLVSAPLTGTEALRLWEAVVAFATVPGVVELSRPRPPRPKIPGLRW